MGVSGTRLAPPIIDSQFFRRRLPVPHLMLSPPVIYLLLQLSLIMTTPDKWICVNVGVDGLDAVSKELSVVWLLVDFFSYYHISEVGNRYCLSRHLAALADTGQIIAAVLLLSCSLPSFFRARIQATRSSPRARVKGWRTRKQGWTCTQALRCEAW